MLFEMQSVVLPKQRLGCFCPGKSSCICEGGLAGANRSSLVTTVQQLLNMLTMALHYDPLWPVQTLITNDGGRLEG